MNFCLLLNDALRHRNSTLYYSRSIGQSSNVSSGSTPSFTQSVQKKAPRSSVSTQDTPFSPRSPCTSSSFLSKCSVRVNSSNSFFGMTLHRSTWNPMSSSRRLLPGLRTPARRTTYLYFFVKLHGDISTVATCRRLLPGHRRSCRIHLTSR